MGYYRGLDVDDGWIQRRFADLERRLNEANAAQRVGSAAVPAGKTMLLTGGGGIRMADGFIEGLDTAGVTRIRFANRADPTQGSSLVFRDQQGNPGLVLGSFYQNGVYQGEGLAVNRYLVTDQVNVAALQLGKRGAADLLTLYDGADKWIMKVDELGVLVRGADGGSLARFLHGTTTTPGSVYFDATTVGFTSVGTTSSAANAYLEPGGNGRLMRSTSSRRYKQDIKPATVDPTAVLKLQPRQFRTKDEVAKQGNDAPTHVGFIAEEAYDAGLHHWVTCDDEGPEAFDYAGFCVAQQAVLQQQSQLLSDQAKVIADLTARVKKLESATTSLNLKL